MTEKNMATPKNPEKRMPKKEGVWVPPIVAGAVILGMVGGSFLYTKNKYPEVFDSNHPNSPLSAENNTQHLNMPTEAVNAAEFYSQSEFIVPKPEEEIKVGSIVEVTNTGGSGLNARKEPGTSDPDSIIDTWNEGDILIVIEPAEEKDNYYWLFVQNLNDGTRAYVADEFVVPVDIIQE